MYKVCHLTSAHDSLDGRIFYKECQSLAQEGFATYLVAKGDSFVKNNVHVIGVGNLRNNRFYRILITTGKIYKAALLLDADVYHFHDPELLPFGLRLKRKGKKVVFDSHENTAEQIKEKEWIPKSLRNLMAKAYARYQKHVIRQLDGIISVTPAICEALHEQNNNTILITNYPIVTKGKRTADKRNNNSIIFAGGIAGQWSHKEIIRAIERIQNVSYQLYGSIEKEYLKELKALPGYEKVTYYGKVSHELIPAILSNSAIGMAVLKYNLNAGKKRGTLGNTKIFEYMMAGIPVICSNTDVFREIIAEHNCGICVEPDDVDEIEQAIRYLLVNKEEAEQMGRNGKKAIDSQYNWGTQERKLIDFYQKILIED